jgi:hypothetical protein
MKGIVEIYSGDELVYKEDNLVVDGASELLADIMTVSPSLSGIEDHATSSILDASNYMVQAISFGKGEKAYQQNAHYGFYPSSKFSFLGSIGTNKCAIITSEEFPNIELSSYSPFLDLPTAPAPMDTRLETYSDVSAYGPDIISLGAVAVSSYVPGNGQNLNFIPGDYFSSILSGNPLFDYVGGSVPASVLGCYPDGSALGGTEFYIYSALGDLGINKGTSITPLSGTYESLFNSVSSMDLSGFVNMAASSWVDARYSLGNPYGPDPSYSGMIVSAADGFSSTDGGGEVQYIVTASGEDIAAANLYGGIYNMGLWTIDMDKSLTAGNTPPFSFHPIYNPRKYKLFAKKGFSKNLCYIKDNGTNAGINNYQNLRIIWRIRFL